MRGDVSTSGGGDDGDMRTLLIVLAACCGAYLAFGSQPLGAASAAPSASPSATPSATPSASPSASPSAALAQATRSTGVPAAAPLAPAPDTAAGITGSLAALPADSARPLTSAPATAWQTAANSSRYFIGYFPTHPGASGYYAYDTASLAGQPRWVRGASSTETDAAYVTPLGAASGDGRQTYQVAFITGGVLGSLELGVDGAPTTPLAQGQSLRGLVRAAPGDLPAPVQRLISAGGMVPHTYLGTVLGGVYSSSQPDGVRFLSVGPPHTGGPELLSSGVVAYFVYTRRASGVVAYERYAYADGLFFAASAATAPQLAPAQVAPEAATAVSTLAPATLAPARTAWQNAADPVRCFVAFFAAQPGSSGYYAYDFASSLRRWVRSSTVAGTAAAYVTRVGVGADGSETYRVTLGAFTRDCTLGVSGATADHSFVGRVRAQAAKGDLPEKVRTIAAWMSPHTYSVSGRTMQVSGVWASPADPVSGVVRYLSVFPPHTGGPLVWNNANYFVYTQSRSGVVTYERTAPATGVFTAEATVARTPAGPTAAAPAAARTSLPTPTAEWLAAVPQRRVIVLTTPSPHAGCYSHERTEVTLDTPTSDVYIKRADQNVPGSVESRIVHDRTTGDFSLRPAPQVERAFEGTMHLRPLEGHWVGAASLTKRMPGAADVAYTRLVGMADVYEHPGSQYVASTSLYLTVSGWPHEGGASAPASRSVYCYVDSTTGRMLRYLGYYDESSQTWMGHGTGTPLGWSIAITPVVAAAATPAAAMEWNDAPLARRVLFATALSPDADLSGCYVYASSFDDETHTFIRRSGDADSSTRECASPFGCSDTSLNTSISFNSESSRAHFQAPNRPVLFTFTRSLLPLSSAPADTSFAGCHGSD
jgi:hypothetical protein